MVASSIVPILSRRDEMVDIREAADHAGRSDKTIKAWCRDHGIGHRCGPGGSYRVNAIALEMLIHGDLEALELLRRGDRTAERVRLYFDHVGIAA
ncbi:helix-turn-helix domain-containing protein [Jiella pelagia]|uniref:Helix-turn-helix domain-containing protein n=1 Tax=Jiella pelagia TaxID=2986949 RepID=A0ABY7C0T8_9HYPH|nr:helix-turn-helix domain-containing protein [Jiella pelagia]WAP69308.1 hypothetical protein OH818_03135 [Jiella pelagia]